MPQLWAGFCSRCRSSMWTLLRQSQLTGMPDRELNRQPTLAAFAFSRSFLIRHTRSPLLSFTPLMMAHPG